MGQTRRDVRVVSRQTAGPDGEFSHGNIRERNTWSGTFNHCVVKLYI